MGHSVPILSQATVDEAVHFDAKLDDWSMRTLLDTLIIDTLAIDPERLRKDHVRDVLVIESLRCSVRGEGHQPRWCCIWSRMIERRKEPCTHITCA